MNGVRGRSSDCQVEVKEAPIRKVQGEGSHNCKNKSPSQEAGENKRGEQVQKVLGENWIEGKKRKKSAREGRY